MAPEENDPALKKDNTKVNSEQIQVKVNQNTLLVGNYFESASKNGIILLPGFTEHRSSLEGIALSLSKEFKIWLFDINSQGESTGKWDLAEMQKSFTYLYQYILHRYGLSNIGAYGNSIGGMSIGLTAAQCNSDLKAICLASTPASVKDIIPLALCALIKIIPQPLIRYATILFDKNETKNNPAYREKSHRQFYSYHSYQDYAMFGAMKIQNIREIIEGLQKAPSLSRVAKQITLPVLFIFGGEDHFLGIRKNALPENISRMYDRVASTEKELCIVLGADHSLNTTTKTDENFNQDSKYQFVKEMVFSYFMKNLSK